MYVNAARRILGEWAQNYSCFIHISKAMVLFSLISSKRHYKSYRCTPNAQSGVLNGQAESLACCSSKTTLRAMCSQQCSPSVDDIGFFAVQNVRRNGPSRDAVSSKTDIHFFFKFQNLSFQKSAFRNIIKFFLLAYFYCTDLINKSFKSVLKYQSNKQPFRKEITTSIFFKFWLCFCCH